MNLQRSAILLILLSALILFNSGCGAGKAYDIGREAERRGDAALAHDYYVQAGLKRPGNSAIRDGLKRTAPAAAAFWRKQADVAQSQGRCDDAWRMLMKALRIQPDNRTTIEAIRDLESHHGVAIAAAKADWQRRGDAALQVSIARADKPAPEPPQQRAASAQETPAPAASPPDEPTAQAFAGIAGPERTAPARRSDPDRRLELSEVPASREATEPETTDSPAAPAETETRIATAPPAPSQSADQSEQSEETDRNQPVISPINPSVRPPSALR